MSLQYNTPIAQLRLNSRAFSLADLKTRATVPDPLPGLYRSPRFRISSHTEVPLPPLIRPQSISKLKTSSKSHGIIKAFAACTNQGLVRNYNEDRVSIVPRIKINEKDRSISYFSLFDGHGGSSCADYLAENLHQIFFSSLKGIFDIPACLESSFSQAEKGLYSKFLANYDSSGSCALTVVISGNNIYVANVGDSRALLGSSKGMDIYQITVDHKPSNGKEKERIESAGGKVVNFTGRRVSRVLPGKLSVSRAFGDFSAKLKNLGGNPGVLISKPEIFVYPASQEFDYILLASDGIFDVLSNEEVNSAVWEGFHSPGSSHEKVGTACKNVVELAMSKNTFDNVTCMVVLLKNLEDY